jgi:hypothetical protein
MCPFIKFRGRPTPFAERKAVYKFKICIEQLPDELFLISMDGWSPQEVLAHLIGWNRQSIVGCNQIICGEEPFYSMDAENDYSNVNTESAQMYSSKNKAILLSELMRSFDELKGYLQSIDPVEWDEDHGVRYGHWVITVGNTVGALQKDYDAHREEIENWA